MGIIRSWILLVIAGVIICSDNEDGLIAYTCSNINPELQAIDLSHVKECAKSNQTVKQKTVHFQLVQVNDKIPVHVKQCRVMINRLVTHCGMHSHASMVKGGLASYVYELGDSRCREMHNTRSFRVSSDIVVHDIKPNATTTRSITLGGRVDTGSSCSGVSYSDAYGSWDNVIVQGTIEATMRDHISTVDPSVDKIHLQSGITCKYTEGYCMDIIAGDTVWNVSPTGECQSHMYSVLYTGSGELIQKISENDTKMGTYFVESSARTFALTATRITRFCLGDVLSTEHPSLYIALRQESGYMFEQNGPSTESLDLIIYMNAKFVYLDRSSQRNLESLYHELSYISCTTERKTMLTQLTLAFVDPPQFAYNMMNKPGYTAVLAGQIAYVIKCVPVYVRRRSTDRCYQELPVTYNNGSHFLQPRSRILQNIGTEVECNPGMPNLYFLHNTWWGISPSPHPGRSPEVLDPNNYHGWVYKTSPSLATAGVYDEEDLKKVQDRMLFHNDRSAIENNIIRASYGKDIDLQGVSIMNTLTEEHLADLSAKIGEKIWSYFSVFGNISAGLFGIYIVFRSAKFLFDTLIHGQALYTVYGWSFTLIASLWDSMTTCLLHRATMKMPYQRSKGDEQERRASYHRDCLSKDEESLTQYRHSDNTKLYPILPQSLVGLTFSDESSPKQTDSV